MNSLSGLWHILDAHSDTHTRDFDVWFPPLSGTIYLLLPSHEKSYIKGLLSRFARFHSLTGGNEDVWFIMPGPWPYRFSGDPAPSKEGTGSLQDKGIRKKTRSTTVLKNPRSSPCQSSARASFLIINNLYLYIHSWVEPFSALRLILSKIDSLFTKSNET